MLTAEMKKTFRNYEGVKTRFLNKNEHLIPSEAELPLVIEATGRTDTQFLQDFVKANSKDLLEDVATFGAVLFRGFDIRSDKDFEKTLTSIEGLHGISEAFMAEHGRERVGDLKFVLHTNTIYKTGGTLYLGGFHSENYYSPDVPEYISFCCLNPSSIGGETGLIDLEKVYNGLSENLKSKLESKPFFVGKWLVSDVAKRYKVQPEEVEKLCQKFDLPVVGNGDDKLILMFKPSVFINPTTRNKALAINFFSLPSLDSNLRQHFLNDYQEKTWFWHRLIWKLPHALFKSIENLAVFIIALMHSPKELFQITKSKWQTDKALKKLGKRYAKISACFSESDIAQLAALMRQFYSSAVWQKGDILLVDNRKVAHAGMPGSGPRVIRALIANPLKMEYGDGQSGCLQCQERPNPHSIAEQLTEKSH